MKLRYLNNQTRAEAIQSLRDRGVCRQDTEVPENGSVQQYLSHMTPPLFTDYTEEMDSVRDDPTLVAASNNLPVSEGAYSLGPGLGARTWPTVAGSPN